MKTLKCPKCKSENIVLGAGSQTGIYECRDCCYMGPLVLEVEKDERKAKKKAKSR